MNTVARILQTFGPCLVGTALVCCTMVPSFALAIEAEDAAAQAQAQAEAEAQAQAEADAQAQADAENNGQVEDPHAAEREELARQLAEEEARLLAERNAEEAAAAAAAQNAEEGSEAATEEATTTEQDAEAAALEAQRKADEAGAAFDAAYEKYAAAIVRLDELVPLQEELAGIAAQLPDAQAALKKAIDLRIPLVAERQKTRNADEAILNGHLEASMLDTTPLQGLLTQFLASPAAASKDGEAPESLLVDQIGDAYVVAARVVEDASMALQKRISDARAQLATFDTQIDAADKQRVEATATLQDVIDRGNAVAFTIEKTASLVRQDTVDAIAEVDKLDSKIDGVDELKEQAHGWDARNNELRVQALADASTWYDAIDDLGGVEKAIVYGTGLEFREGKSVFVAKWGAAIDKFYEEHGAPLKGYGAKIAEQAYIHEVDPRLCAAVSMVESSGGKECIKPHNAWGWGAADSDPEGLAVSWDSWQQAFEGWHKGMKDAGYTTADGTSLTAMGDIYCSTPNWGSRVATFMEEISSYA